MQTWLIDASTFSTNDVQINRLIPRGRIVGLGHIRAQFLAFKAQLKIEAPLWSKAPQAVQNRTGVNLA
jgi:hypothetical protein